MFIIAIELVVCVVIGIVFLGLFLLCESRFLFQHGQPNNKLDLSADKTDECLLQNVFITHYEQQRGELIARRQTIVHPSVVTVIDNDDSGYTSAPSTAQTPHSLYEYSGFASMENLAVNNPLFSNDLLNDNPEMSFVSTSSK